MAPEDFRPYRVTPRTVRRPPRDKFEPECTLTARVFDDLRAVERADQELRRFQLDSVAARRLLEDALAKNSYGTASIEGNPLSLADVQSLLERGPTPDAMTRPEEREILNYARYLEALPVQTVPSNPDQVRQLHGTLFDGVLGDAGQFKTRPNFVGRRPEMEITFIPARPNRVPPELRRAFRWLHEAPEHPLVRVQVFFHEFESIHPFRDGNGRAGRALVTRLLHAFGYEGVRYALIDYEFNEDRDAYYEALLEVDRNGFDYAPWIAYMSRVLRLTFEGGVQRFLFREGLPSLLTDRQVRVAEWIGRVCRGHPERRIKFNDVHAAFPAIPDRTLKRDLEALRRTGVLLMEGERKAARYSVAVASRARRNRGRGRRA